MRFAKRLTAGLVILFSLIPARASYADLQVTQFSISGNTVTVSVHNPEPGAESARVRVAIVYTDNSTQTLTTGTFTVAAGATTTLVVTTPKSVSGLTDDPEPVSP